MFKIKRTLAIAALALTTAAALPAMAASPAPAAPAAPAAGHQAEAGNSVDSRINTLHDQLHITAAQAAKWDAVAKVMRDNAESYTRLVERAGRNAATMTAVESLRTYERIATAHAAGAKRLVAAFEALYATMPADQKKITDEVFREHKQQHDAEKAKK